MTKEQSDNQHEMQPNQPLPILFRLTRRCAVFFMLLLICTLLFYISGNYQRFLDSNQQQLLYLCTVFSLILAFFTFCCAGESVFYIIRRKDNKVLFTAHLVIMFLLFIISMLIAFCTGLIDYLSLGI